MQDVGQGALRRQNDAPGKGAQEKARPVWNYQEENENGAPTLRDVHGNGVSDRKGEKRAQDGAHSGGAHGDLEYAEEYLAQGLPVIVQRQDLQRNRACDNGARTRTEAVENDPEQRDDEENGPPGERRPGHHPARDQTAIDPARDFSRGQRGQTSPLFKAFPASPQVLRKGTG